MTEKVALVFFNLGGPLAREDIKPFLFNFFSDPNIIAAPWPVRKLLAWWISFKRSKEEALVSYKALGYKSPLLETTLKQAESVTNFLQKNTQDLDLKHFVSMSYWHPFAEDAVQDILKYNPDRIIGIPLYPQYSTTTTKTAFEYFLKAAHKQGLSTEKLSLICCWPEETGFIQASTRLVREKLNEATEKVSEGRSVRLLFSAHGLPEKVIKSGDPYQSHCEKTAQKIVESLEMTDLDWGMCYQSRVGPLKWIGPSTEEALDQAAHDQKDVVIYPLAFVSEHVETLVEIEEEYREYAEDLGIEGFYRVPTVMTEPEFIEGLANIVGKRLSQQNFGICSDSCQKKCDRQFGKCAMATKDRFSF